MAKKWWKEQNQQSGEAKAEPAPASEAPAEQVESPVAGVPSREHQEAEGQKIAATAPPQTEAEKTSVTAASGDAKQRTAPSAPGGTITTKDGTFTREEWEERQRAGRELE